MQFPRASVNSISEITPLILTYNETPNLARTLDRLRWAGEILIVDSFSTDATLAIARAYPQVRLLQRKFESFAAQCNFALEHIRTPWVLSMDADYVLTPELVDELSCIRFDPELAGFQVKFRYCILGQPLRSSLYPPRTVLYRRERARYLDHGHSHRVQIAGQVGRLSGQIEHDDRKPLDRWLHEQNRYALAEARNLVGTPRAGLNLQDRVRRHIIIAPWAIGLYTLFGRGLVFDGWRGVYYVLQRVIFEALLSLRLLELRLQP